MICPIMSNLAVFVDCQEKECAWWEEICVNPKAGKIGWLKGCSVAMGNSKISDERQAEKIDNNN